MKKFFIILFLTYPLLGQSAFCQCMDNPQDVVLHDAAFLNKTDQIRALLAAKIDVNKRDCQNRTPLHYAIMGNSYQTLVILLENGADVNVQDKNGETPIHNASAIRPEKFLASLLKPKYKGDVNIRDNKGETALFKVDKPIKVSLLIERGAQVNIRNKEGNTPLHLFCSSIFDTNIALALLDNNADCKISNNKKESPYDLASRSGNVTLLRRMNKNFMEDMKHKLEKFDKKIYVTELCSSCAFPS